MSIKGGYRYMNHREQFEKETGYISELSDDYNSTFYYFKGINIAPDEYFEAYSDWLEKSLDDKTKQVEEYKQKSLDTVHSHKEMQEYLTKQLNDKDREIKVHLKNMDALDEIYREKTKKYRDALERIIKENQFFSNPTCRDIAQQALSTECDKNYTMAQKEEALSNDDIDTIYSSLDITEEPEGDNCKHGKNYLNDPLCGECLDEELEKNKTFSGQCRHGIPIGRYCEGCKRDKEKKPSERQLDMYKAMKGTGER